MPIRKNTTNKVNNKENNINESIKKGYKRCPFCDKEIKEQAIKCQYCKNFLNKAKKECPFCFNEIDADSLKCPFCDEFLELSDDVDEATKNYASLSELCKDVKEKDEEDEYSEENEDDYFEEDENNNSEEDEDYNSDNRKNKYKKYTCDACNKEVTAYDKTCPHCGKEFEDGYTARDWGAILILIFLGICIIGAIMSN